jgi:hypothetical protein
MTETERSVLGLSSDATDAVERDRGPKSRIMKISQP